MPPPSGNGQVSGGASKQGQPRPRIPTLPDPALFPILLILSGPFIGSFLAVLADRLPRGEDIVAKPSACRACGHRLGLRDLVPVLSFALSRGRCRHCGAALPGWLLYTEIAATGLAVLAVAAGGTGPDMALAALLLWLLLALGLSDLLWFRLPDLLSAALFVTALIMALPGGMTMALAGAAGGAGSFLALRLGYRALRGREGLGLGDVKLMAGLGAFAGLPDLPLLVLIAALLALAGALPGALRSPRGLAARPVPFGTALCAAAALLWLLRAAGILIGPG